MHLIYKISLFLERRHAPHSLILLLLITTGFQTDLWIFKELHCVSVRVHQLSNGIARNYKNRF